MSIIHLFEGQEVRFVGTWENPEWVAADVIAILYPNASVENRANYLKTVPKKWKGIKKINTLGGMQDMVTLLEPGLHRFVSRSDSSLALPFQEWLFEEVIPSIRKTGSYSLNQPKIVSSYDLNLEQVMCLSGYMWVPKQRELDNPNGCEDVHVTKERFAEIMDSIDPIFKEVFFCLDAGKNLMSIIKYPIELAALPEAIAQSKELNRQKFENPDPQMSFYLQEVFGDRNLTDAQILEEINDRVESKLTALVEDLHYTAFESDRHLAATAALEAALQRRQLGGSSTKGLGFGKK
jgi:prophage antirepressor-like protein